MFQFMDPFDPNKYVYQFNEVEFMIIIAALTYPALLSKNLSGLSIPAYIGAIALL